MITNFLRRQITGRAPYPHPAMPVSPAETTPHSLIAATRRELAIFASDMMGAQTYVGQFDRSCMFSGLTRRDRNLFRDLIEDSPLPCLVIDPRPNLRIIDMNDAYASATMSNRRRVPGDKLFDTFPDNPGLADADGVGNLFESLQKAAQTGQRHTMAIQRYDVRDADGHFIERHWRPQNTPIFDDAGRLLYLLHQVVEVSDEERSNRSSYF